MQHYVLHWARRAKRRRRRDRGVVVEPDYRYRQVSRQRGVRGLVERDRQCGPGGDQCIVGSHYLLHRYLVHLSGLEGREHSAPARSRSPALGRRHAAHGVPGRHPRAWSAATRAPRRGRSWSTCRSPALPRWRWWVSPRRWSGPAIRRPTTSCRWPLRSVEFVRPQLARARSPACSSWADWVG